MTDTTLPPMNIPTNEEELLTLLSDVFNFNYGEYTLPPIEPATDDHLGTTIDSLHQDIMDKIVFKQDTPEGEDHVVEDKFDEVYNQYPESTNTIMEHIVMPWSIDAVSKLSEIPTERDTVIDYGLILHGKAKDREGIDRQKMMILDEMEYREAALEELKAAGELD